MHPGMPELMKERPKSVSVIITFTQIYRYFVFVWSIPASGSTRTIFDKFYRNSVFFSNLCRYFFEQISVDFNSFATIIELLKSSYFFGISLTYIKNVSNPELCNFLDFAVFIALRYSFSFFILDKLAFFITFIADSLIGKKHRETFTAFSN